MPENPSDIADLLGVEPVQLESATVRLEIGGVSIPEITIAVDLISGATASAPLPERFFDDTALTVDMPALMEWLDLAVVEGLPVYNPVVHDGTEGSEASWHFEVVGEFLEPPTTDSLDVGRLAGLEGQDSMMAGAPGPRPRPAVGDTDAWPDSVDEWLEDIDARVRHNPATTAAMIRVMYGGAALDPHRSAGGCRRHRIRRPDRPVRR